EYGRWDLPYLQFCLIRSLESLPNRTWHGYHVFVGDDTKVHRDSADVWGTCTFHEYTARCPNRAQTVRAHNWVVLGALLPVPDQPALCLPTAASLYFRNSQLPKAHHGPPIVFRTKCELLVELARQHAKACSGKALGVFDGGFALRSVVRPLVKPDDPQQPRIDFVTRLRHDARLNAWPDQQRRPGQRGPTPVWGKPLPPPRQGGRWPGAWQQGQVLVYGRVRLVRYKAVVCLWRRGGGGRAGLVRAPKVEGLREAVTLGRQLRRPHGPPNLEGLFGRVRLAGKVPC